MKVKPLAEHPSEPVGAPGARGASMRMLIGPKDGAQKFYLRYFHIEPGGVIPLHSHPFEHEVLVLPGKGQVTLGKDVYAVGQLDVIWVPPDVEHEFRAADSEPFEFVCAIPADARR